MSVRGTARVIAVFAAIAIGEFITAAVFAFTVWTALTQLFHVSNPIALFAAGTVPGFCVGRWVGRWQTVNSRKEVP